MSQTIEKRIFTGDLTRLVQLLPAGTARGARELDGLSLTHQVRGFESKDAYAGLPIMQIAVLVRSGTQVLLATRASSEEKAGAEQPRITEGASVLLSSSPLEDPEAILAAKLRIHTGAKIGVNEGAVVAHNDVKGTPYIFQVSVADFLDPADVVGMQPGNKDVVRFAIQAEVLAALEAEKRAMELAIMRVLFPDS